MFADISKGILLKRNPKLLVETLSMKWNTDRLSYAMVSGLLLSTSAWLAGGIAAQAQVTPDGTMGTSISQTGANFTINGGTRPSNGPNLFHSFSQFSVPTGGSAFFNNATTYPEHFCPRDRRHCVHY